MPEIESDVLFLKLRSTIEIIIFTTETNSIASDLELKSLLCLLLRSSYLFHL